MTAPEPPVRGWSFGGRSVALGLGIFALMTAALCSVLVIPATASIYVGMIILWGVGVGAPIGHMVGTMFALTGLTEFAERRSLALLGLALNLLPLATCFDFFFPILLLLSGS